MEENPYKAPSDQADKPKSVWSQPVPWISFAVVGASLIGVKVIVAYTASGKVSSNVSTAIGVAIGVAIASLTCKDWPRGKPPA